MMETTSPKRRTSSHYSVYAISKSLNQVEPLLLYGDFLDTFYHESDEVRQQLIRDEPLYSETHKVFLCQLAAAVETLARRFHLDVPSWVYKQNYFLDTPHYALNTKNEQYQEFLRHTSPDTYSKRNLFLGDGVLQRV